MASIILIGNKATKLENLNDAISTAGSDNIIIANASAPLSNMQLEKLAAHSCSDNEIIYISNNELAKEEINSLDTESLLNTIIARSALPVSAILIKKQSVRRLLAGDAESFAEAMAEIFTRAIADGMLFNYSGHLETDISEEELTNSSCARCLSIMVNTMTIEELFPLQAWKEHSGESAATSYHTLAAYFMRFDDYVNADECLQLSEQFEESPRALALRALIAFNKGETLGAVANLVSSLQQYEERKKSTTHYVKFNPQDIEIINSSLVSGLDALNKRDNQKALDFFAKAVFNFDGFYAQHGLLNIIQ